jgi:predicted nuclease with TOPRIM domain
MLDDAKYLKSLDDMRPGFLKSLSELASHIKNVKDIVDQRLIKDEYKDEMMTILSDLHFNTHNISGYLATVFMNHYNKYKNRVQSDNGNYSEDIKRLNSLAIEYKEQSQKLVKLENEKARLEDILTRMKSTLTLSVSQREDFERMMKEVMVMFNALSRRCSTME